MTLVTYMTSNNFNTLNKNYVAGNILEENLKGSQVSNSILINYFNQRAIIEKEYCEKLKDLSKIFDNSSVVGRIKSIFNVTKNELLSVSNIKLHLYDLINNQYEKSFAELSSQQNEEFQKYYENITDERKKLIETYNEKEERFKEYSVVKNELINLINEYKKSYEDGISKKIDETFEKEKKLRIKYIYSKDKYDKEKRTCMSNHNETSESFIFLERERTEFIIKHLNNYINNLILINHQELETYNILINNLSNIYSSNDQLDEISLQFNDLLNSKDENSIEQVNKDIEKIQSEFKNEKKLRKFRKGKKKQNILHVQNVTENEKELSENKEETTVGIIKSEDSPTEEIINTNATENTNIINNEFLSVNDNRSTMSSLISKHSLGLVDFDDLIETIQNYDRSLDRTENTSVISTNTIPNNNVNNNNNDNNRNNSNNNINNVNNNNNNTNNTNNNNNNNNTDNNNNDNNNNKNVYVKLKLNDMSFYDNKDNKSIDNNQEHDNKNINNHQVQEFKPVNDQFNNIDSISKINNNIINNNINNKKNNINTGNNDNNITGNNDNNDNNNNTINNNVNNNKKSNINTTIITVNTNINTNTNNDNNKNDNNIDNNNYITDHERSSNITSPSHTPRSPLQNRSFSQGVIPTHTQNQYPIRTNMSFSAHSSPMFKRNSSDSDKTGSIKSSHSRSSFGSMLSSIFQSQSGSSHKLKKSNDDKLSINSESSPTSNISPNPKRLSSKNSIHSRPRSAMYYSKNNGTNEKPLNRQIYYKPPSNSRHESLCYSLNRSERSSSIRDGYYTPQLRETHYSPNSPRIPSLSNKSSFVSNRSPNIPFIDINPSAMVDTKNLNDMENKGKIIQTMRSNTSLNTSISNKNKPMSNQADIHIQKMNNNGKVQSTLNYNYDPYDISIVKPILFYVRVLFDYNSQIYEEISVRKDMIIPILETQEDGWWEGEIEEMGPAGRRRRRGLLPSNFVEIIKKI